MERIFPTFCHITDYSTQGFNLIPQMIETSYPLILWAPPGARVNEYYKSGVCPISPEKLIKYVERGFVEIVGREKWLLDERYRQHYADSQSFAMWHDNFDGALKSIWRNQQSMPEGRRSVKIAPDEDGWEWAQKLMEEEPERIDPIWERIKKKQIPLVSGRRIQQYGDDKEKCVKQVLRDARDHMKAIADVNVDMPFLLHRNEGNFFKFLERSGTHTLPQKKQSAQQPIKLQFAQEAHNVLEHLKNPEKFPSLEKFVGSEMHKDFAKWLHTTADLAHFYWSKQTLKAFMVKKLKYDIESGIQAADLLDLLGEGQAVRVATVGGLVTSIASMFLTGMALDPNTALAIGGLILNVVPIISGISQRLGIVKPGYTGPQWPYLARFDRAPTKQDITEVKAKLDLLLAALREE